VIEAGLELTVKAGGSFIKIDAGGVTVLGPVVKVNAGGTPGSGTGIDIKAPGLPLIADQARPGRLLKSTAVNSSIYDEQLRFLTGTGKPVRSVKAAIDVPSSVAPKISTSNADGLHPRIKSENEEAAEVRLRWDDLVVPSGADNYQASRNK